MRWIIAHTNAFGLLLIVSLAFNVGFGTTFGVRAFHHIHGSEGDGGGHFASLHERLRLSEDQNAEVKSSGDRLFDQIDELRLSLRIETDALADLITSDVPDHQQLIAHHLERMGHVRSQIERHALKHFLDVRGLLQADQRSQFDEMIRTHVLQYNGFAGDDEGSAHGPQTGRPGRFGHGDEHGHADHP